MKLHQAQNSWHSDYWSFKFLLLVSAMVASFFIPQLYIQIYGIIMFHYSFITFFSICYDWFDHKNDLFLIGEIARVGAG